MTPAEPPVPSFVMDRPVLHTLLPELLEDERLERFAGAQPTSARVSEPALPLLLAALHERLGAARGASTTRGLVALLPEDADARDAAEAARWFLGEERVALFPSRGVRWGSGLEPPPHLVGERARALDVIARGGLVCASAAALAEPIPPPGARPEPLDLALGDERGIDAVAETLALAGYERVERVEERGQFAVRGGLVDVFPTTGREPLRIEWFGDELESMRAFSPFTQRTLHPVERATVYPAAERRSDLVEPTLPDLDGGQTPRPVPDDLVRPLERAPDLVWQPDDVRRVWEEEGLAPVPLDGATELDPLPQSQPFAFEAQRPAIAARGLAEAENELGALVRAGQRVVVAFAHRGEALRTKGLLRRVEPRILEPGEPLPREAELLFVVSPARRGFVWRELGLVLLPDTQVFRKRPPRADARLGRALQSFADLRTGDYVVHEDHGVGKLLAFETKEVAEVTRDYLMLAFRGDDRLYVPHEQIGKVSRYIGADGKSPALSKLGGRAWQNLKARARQGVRELAGELLALYAQRQQASGFAQDLEHEWLERLEAGFPYRETPDQQVAIEAVKEDLEAPRPMDRLLCGDVGFGKTEVAVRTAFATALNGKQTLMLVPTTVLAQQHWNTFRERYRDFPVRVEMVSRFRKPADVKRILAEFGEGKVDVLIGTHRVLSRDVIPKELGLVIVDEEQRFGVAQKELLRQLRLEVDVLALTATPIPRTLHMSLSGLRDISVIETPPEGRRPIRTHVGEFDDEIIRLALSREAERGGQSFYLHNRVETIEERAAWLQELCPNLRFLVAHGQMREKELEDRMVAFLRGDADVLVSTSIIESGIDIPQANTLIVDRADLFGLSQLYQIRGRVGRSRERAYAYLLYPSAAALTPEAADRLSALSDYTELGAGFKVAMRDLELRGAGNLLGDEQSGHVAALGFELYMQMLDEAVQAMASDDAAEYPEPVRLDVNVDAYVPADYIPYEQAKVEVHRRIAGAREVSELMELRRELDDRFGELPEPLENLITLQQARIKLGEAGATAVTFRQGRLAVTPIEMDSVRARKLREEIPNALYESGKSQFSMRVPDDPAQRFPAVVRAADALLAVQRDAA